LEETCGGSEAITAAEGLRMSLFTSGAAAEFVDEIDGCKGSENVEMH